MKDVTQNGKLVKKLGHYSSGAPNGAQLWRQAPSLNCNLQTKH
jgi:hypothetical protein